MHGDEDGVGERSAEFVPGCVGFEVLVGYLGEEVQA